MVEMHSWDEFLKAEKVTLAGMDRPFRRQGLSHWAHGTQLRPNIGVNPATGRTAPSFTGQMEWNKPIRAPDNSYTHSRGPLRWFQEQQDRYRLLQMWRRQQQALSRRAASNDPMIPGKFGGKMNAGHARKYLWKPGDEFVLYTPEGRRAAHPKGDTGKGPIWGLKGGLMSVINRLLSHIPGLRDPSEINEKRQRLENTRKGYRALEYFHKMKAMNPNWEMSSGDQSLVSNMLYDYYTEEKKLDPAAARMMARGASKWDEEMMDSIHQGLEDYMGEYSPENFGGVRGRQIGPEDLKEVVAGVNEIRQARRSKKGGPPKEDFSAFKDIDPNDMSGAEGADVAGSRVVDYDLSGDKMREIFGGVEPTRAASAGDPASTTAGWQQNAAALQELSNGLTRTKALIHHDRSTKQRSLGHHQNLGDLIPRVHSLEDMFFHGESPLTKYLNGGESHGEKINRGHARQIMNHVYQGYLDGHPAHHDTMNNMVGFLLGPTDYVSESTKTDRTRFPHWNPDRPATFFGPEPAVNTEQADPRGGGRDLTEDQGFDWSGEGS